MYRQLAWPVFVPSVLVGVARGATLPVSVLAAMQLGASAALASLIIALVGGAALLTTVPAGRFIDHVGDRPAMLVSVAAGAVCTAAIVGALVWGGQGALSLFVVAMVLNAPVMSVWTLSRQALVADQVPTVQRGRAMTALGGTLRAGNLVGPLLGAALLLRLPIWSVYVLSIGCALLALAVLYSPAGAALDVAARERGGGRGARPAGGPGRALVAPGAQRAGASLPTGPASAHVRWRAVTLAGAAVGALAVARAAQPVALQLWGVQLGLTASAISTLVAVGAAVELVLMLPGGHLKDRVGRTPVLIVCLAVYGAGFLLMPTLPSPPGMVTAVLVMALGNGLGAGINMTIGADLSPEVGRARFLGVWALFSGAGVLLGPATVSALVAIGGIGLALTGVGGVALGGAAWTAAVARAVGLPRGLGRDAPGTPPASGPPPTP
ncbi:MFS transporter [Ornithinimicrobium avium]|uniref:MFS transporter n=1 Tax=Ornithinimicrobium avium TaxID=2283195 RepID=A0A345NQI0_9MICO|nr:MFS transporter [Ornithinimicrobium avium]AXH97288.1 MFS transporter [Ornithinimicrobium avium]